MRLKILLTPMAFFIAVVVAIWFVWPAIMDVQTNMDDIKASESKLQSSENKKANSEALANSLNSNKEKEDFVLSYLPPSRSEDKIVNGINYMATSSGLNLMSIDVSDDKDAVAQQAPSESIALDTTNAGSPMDATSSGDVQTAQPLKAKFSDVKISFSGKYSNIKIFLEQVYAMKMLNKITSLKIETSGSTDASSGSEATLLVNADIKFGYMPLIRKEGDTSKIFTKNEFDFSAYSELQKQATSSVPGIDGMQAGKEDPFSL